MQGVTGVTDLVEADKGVGHPEAVHHPRRDVPEERLPPPRAALCDVTPHRASLAGVRGRVM